MLSTNEMIFLAIAIVGIFSTLYWISWTQAMKKQSQEQTELLKKILEKQ